MFTPGPAVWERSRLRTGDVAAVRHASPIPPPRGTAAAASHHPRSSGGGPRRWDPTGARRGCAASARRPSPPLGAGAPDDDLTGVRAEAAAARCGERRRTAPFRRISSISRSTRHGSAPVSRGAAVRPRASSRRCPRPSARAWSRRRAWSPGIGFALVAFTLGRAPSGRDSSRVPGTFATPAQDPHLRPRDGRGTPRETGFSTVRAPGATPPRAGRAGPLVDTSRAGRRPPARRPASSSRTATWRRRSGRDEGAVGGDIEEQVDLQAARRRGPGAQGGRAGVAGGGGEHAAGECGGTVLVTHGGLGRGLGS